MDAPKVRYDATRPVLVQLSSRRYLVIMPRTEGITGAGGFWLGDVLHGPDTYEGCIEFNNAPEPNRPLTEALFPEEE